MIFDFVCLIMIIFSWRYRLAHLLAKEIYPMIYFSKIDFFLIVSEGYLWYRPVSSESPYFYT